MIVVFGGSFNPPTIAHYEIAMHILKQNFCKKFYFLPVGDAYPKRGLITAKHRVAMLELLCEKLPQASVSLIEVQSEKVLTTYETLSQLQKKYPEEEIAFIIGADNLKDLPNWFQYEQLMKTFKLIVFKRDDIEVNQLISNQFPSFKDRFIVLDAFHQRDISSTMYRENPNLTDLVLESVDDYIKRHQLYGRGE